MRSEKTKIVRLLKTARGQVDGVLKMVEEDRYCIDISHQLMAIQAILRAANRQILDDHLEHCVREAFAEGDARPKIEEILAIIDKLTSAG